jgi:hypothetical protein
MCLHGYKNKVYWTYCPKFYISSRIIEEHQEYQVIFYLEFQVTVIKNYLHHITFWRKSIRIIYNRKFILKKCNFRLNIFKRIYNYWYYNKVNINYNYRFLVKIQKLTFNIKDVNCLCNTNYTLVILCLSLNILGNWQKNCHFLNISKL